MSETQEHADNHHAEEMDTQSQAEEALFEALFEDHVAQEEDELVASALVPGSELEQSYLTAVWKRHPPTKQRRAGSQRHTDSLQSAQAVTTQVMDALLGFAPDSLRHTDKERIKRIVLTSNHNTRTTAAAEPSSTAPKPERGLDRQIRAAFVTHRPLCAAAVERARRQFDVLTEARHSTPASFTAAIAQCYSGLVDSEGHTAVPRAAAMSVPVQIKAASTPAGPAKQSAVASTSLTPKANACGQHKAFTHQMRIAATM